MTPPLTIDSRTILEATSAALTVLLVGINNVGLDNTYALVGGLIILAIITFVNRLLGKNATDGTTVPRPVHEQALARNTVLVAGAKPDVILKADEAAVSFGAPPSEALKAANPGVVQ